MTHKFVEFIPKTLEDGVIYISIEYGAVTHTCCCGCGEKVFTPLSPTDWKLEFDGKTISLYPSIGSWGLPCKSHYWIRNNKIIWARQWTEEEIEYGRAQDSFDKAKYYGQNKQVHNDNISFSSIQHQLSSIIKSFWFQLKRICC